MPAPPSTWRARIWTDCRRRIFSGCFASTPSAPSSWGGREETCGDVGGASSAAGENDAARGRSQGELGGDMRSSSPPPFLQGGRSPLPGAAQEGRGGGKALHSSHTQYSRMEGPLTPT